jgi:hypothetical protein
MIIMPGTRIFIIVVIKFIAPKTEDKPATCKLNMDNQPRVQDELR